MIQYVLKTAQDELLWFDAVTGLGEEYSGSLTAHPVESGGTVTDHFTVSNDSLSITAIISNYDFLLDRTIRGDLEGISATTTLEAPVVKVSSNKPGFLDKIMPEAIANIISSKIPEVELSERGDILNEELVKSFIKILFKKAEVVSILGFDTYNGMVLVEDYTGFVITNLSFSREANDLDALAINMNLEKPRFVSTQRAFMPTTATKGLEKQVKTKTVAGGAESQEITTAGAVKEVLSGDGVRSGLATLSDTFSDFVNRR